ncbi:stress protein [Janibacter sp. Soil728]|uniref:Dabb family protein n=1 Tax=Janibacter sp. Soil728 TaxID=1736393 RepID=UPI0006F6251B|nr:Dabb family protein [Janibacter sp. Soil728]KRE38958.1 stress protein [Janibacter sp. Soil728]
MIRHVFAWQVADDADGGEVIQLLTDFSKEVDMIRYFEIGAHAGEPNDNGDPWDGVLITDFDSWGDLEAYSNHPAHLVLVEKLLPKVKGRVVVDFLKEDK